MNSSKKIMVVLPWGNGTVAGAEKQTIILVNALSSRGFDLSVVVFVKGFADETKIRSCFPSSTHVRILSGVRARSILPDLIKEVRIKKPDLLIGNVLHVCVHTIFASWLSGIFCPVISINHGMDFSRVEDRWQARLVTWFSKKVVVVSAGLKENLVSILHLNKQKITVIENMFDLDEIRRKSNEIINDLPIGNPFIVSVGRLEEKQKAMSVLLQAFLLVKNTNKNLTLFFIGDGPDRKQCEEFVLEHHMTESVFFLGWKDNPYPWIKQAKALVLSSRFEGFGRVIVEALALGTPVVSTDCPSGPKEILSEGKFGALVPLDDPKSLSCAIEHAVQTKANNELLISRAEEYSVEKGVEKYVQIIKLCCSVS